MKKTCLSRKLDTIIELLEELVVKKTVKRVSNKEPKSTEAWAAYSKAYRFRYGISPQRNAAANNQLCSLVDRMGKAGAVEAARFYLNISEDLYKKGMHPIALLVRDCQKIYTQSKNIGVTNRPETKVLVREEDPSVDEDLTRKMSSKIMNQLKGRL